MKRTLKTLIVLAAFAGFASAANAATVVLSSNSLTYLPGETITLTTTVTATALEFDNSIFGAVLRPSALLVTPVASSNVQTVYPPPGWGLGAMPACTTLVCRAFSQVAFPSATAGTGSPFAIGTMQFTVNAGVLPGTVVTFNWQTTPTAQRLDFYGVTNAPGASVTIVPEPTTAAMLGLGLFGLALAGRRRS